MKLLVTGGAGFIGSNFVHQTIAKHPDWKLVVLDKLTYAGNLKNLEPELGEGRCEFVQMDICDPGVVEQVRGCDAVIHFAAESHVDRSIEDASAFVKHQRRWHAQHAAGVPRGGRAALRTRLDRRGLRQPGRRRPVHRADSPIQPNSPYSATKASSDLLVLAYVHTHKFPGIVTRCSNNYGPYQFPEKFIPLMIANAMAGEKVPVYGKGANVRDWIHVDDHCSALLTVLEKGREGEVYNVGGGCEMQNLEVVKLILKALGKAEELIQFVTDRPGHDLRYAIDCTEAGARAGMDAAGAVRQGAGGDDPVVSRQSGVAE